MDKGAVMTPERTPESELIARSLEGDGDAFGKLVEPYLGLFAAGIQRILQGQSRLAQLLVLQRPLLVQLGQFFLQAATTQGQLLDLGLLRR